MLTNPFISDNGANVKVVEQQRKKIRDLIWKAYSLSSVQEASQH